MTTSATFWDGLAEQYATKPVDDPAAFDKKTEITRALIRPGDQVLNIGCGTGSLSLRLAETGAELHGLDISKEMLRIAREKAETQKADNIHFHVGPFDEGFDVFEEGSLDGVMAYSILHLLPNRTPAIGHMYRLLKPGGFFISSTVCLGETWIPYWPMLKVAKLLGKAPWVAILRKAQLVQEIRDAGFVSIEQPEVGAESTISFIVARKPADRAG